ncbi:helix-turn-helix transcriptional regulator [Methylobacterium sp. WL7]|nr:helix-turn-helix transcriptional regulator [Methylobacterium sp. WL7]
MRETFDIADGDLDLHDGTGRDVIKRLLAKARTRIQLDGENWMLTTRASRRPLIMSTILVPVLGEKEPHTVLILIDLERTPRPNTTALERIFGLTVAEARLAAVLAGGATVAEAAIAHKVSVATVRTQLAAIFAKTHTSRQAELVMLVSRLSALP